MGSMFKLNLFLAFLLGVIAISAIALSCLTQFKPLQKALQGNAVPTEILRYGPMGRILIQLGLVTYDSNDYGRFKKTETSASDFETITFQKKRQVGETILVANPNRKIAYKSTSVIDPGNQKPGWPILSIVTDPDFLDHPETGLHNNQTKKGRSWEKVAQVSYIENAKVQFETHVGLRIHGGNRLLSETWSPDYRLYFRATYGLEAVPYAMILPRHEVPVKTLVVKRMEWPEEHPANNPLAYDIARKIGTAVPDTRLVELYINGESLGMAYAVEHLSRRQWGQRYGHDEYNFLKFKSDSELDDLEMYHRQFWEPLHDDEHFTFENVSKKIDLDNFSRHLFSWVFAATNDYCQGVAVFDKTDQKARLSWINWDMDHSFYFDGPPESGMAIHNWQDRSFDMVFTPPFTCGRTLLFYKLMTQSETYRLKFSRLVTEIMNHRLTQDFLTARVDYYRQQLESFGEPHHAYIKMLQLFMAHRAEYLFSEMRELFDFTGPYTLAYHPAEADCQLTIDGYLYNREYTGRYFSETPVEIALLDAGGCANHSLQVNGRRVEGPAHRLTLKENTVIEVVKE